MMFRGVDIVTRQSPLSSASQPFHPRKNDPEIACAFSRTPAPLSKFAAQIGAEQRLIPVGVVDRRPPPEPLRVTVRVCRPEVNVASTLWDCVICTMQVGGAVSR